MNCLLSSKGLPLTVKYELINIMCFFFLISSNLIPFYFTDTIASAEETEEDDAVPIPKISYYEGDSELQ